MLRSLNLVMKEYRFCEKCITTNEIYTNSLATFEIKIF
jgi:hypothetical protein